MLISVKLYSRIIYDSYELTIVTTTPDLYCTSDNEV